jgi:hypothetical protein
MAHTGVIRSPDGEIEPRKVPNPGAGIHIKTPDSIRKHPLIPFTKVAEPWVSDGQTGST